jgi:membrane fusion protein (multidrug efflux system)
MMTIPLKESQPTAVLVLFVAATALTATSCKQEQGPAQLPPPTVEVMAVVPTNVPLTAEFIGQLDSPQNVEVRARVEAFVGKVLFAEGREVKEGDLLFALDKKPFQERLAAAQGMLAEAKAALNKCEKDVARLQPLAEKRAIPQQDLDNAVASVDVSKANVLSAEARVESANIDLGYCDVKAPVSGLIGAKQVPVGSLVGKGQPTLLATISTLDPIWFYCALSEVDYLRAERKVRETGRRVTDLPVTLILADGSEHPDTGKWVFLDRAVDVTTGTLRARAEFANSKNVLRPGMFARVRINLKTEKDSILVPQRAVQELQGKNFVWVVDADNKSTQRPVTPGPSIGSDVIIQEGLKPGERVIVEGVQKARHGELVQPRTAAQMAEAAQAANQAETKPAKEGEAKHGKE